ncbi:hypothetical protein [Brumimicrobium oceani]|uniref:Uncharacterized protein n=1 Tax=Brumimicrobium oceani TaxID=2100725 RepID=A0A2U2XA34_9FLAO|nr:hypothetical protein [Brumimicrobium oceani]PWH84648.1 hypothetical protein DIT68_13055 [Brumimicrobium oceani]
MNIVLKETLGFVDIKIYDNNIFHTNVVGKVPLTVAQAKEITAFRMDNMGGKKALMLYTRDDRYTVPTPEVIEYIKSTDRKEHVLGDAFVIKLLSKIVCQNIEHCEGCPGSYILFCLQTESN